MQREGFVEQLSIFQVKSRSQCPARRPCQRFCEDFKAEKTPHFVLNPLSPPRIIKSSFYIPENRLNFPTTKGFRMNISSKLVYQYMAIFFTFSPTSSHLHPLQVENSGLKELSL